MSDRLPSKDGCPVCFHRLDAATCTTGDAQPQPGDLTVCLYCTAFLRFDADLRHIALASGEFSALDKMEKRALVRARHLIKARERNATNTSRGEGR